MLTAASLRRDVRTFDYFDSEARSLPFLSNVRAVTAVAFAFLAAHSLPI